MLAKILLDDLNDNITVQVPSKSGFTASFTWPIIYVLSIALSNLFYCSTGQYLKPQSFSNGFEGMFWSFGNLMLHAYYSGAVQSAVNCQEVL